ncbi:MAG: biopolymer transporter ExbD [Bacteroidota bacterium]|nr:biopolymer transporter ExbD [Candidatus Kapabacteria bacterium]MDW8220672.1 biopolymer transporter ExbD [Bacteroidota bacterium]
MGGGGGGLSVQPRVKRGSFATVRKKKKRVGFVLDMTPLVDIAFLLLTFFMLSTTLTTPQVMEMSIPPETENVEVKQSELLTILVRDDGQIFKVLGDKKQNPPEKVALKDLRALSINENMRLENRLIVALRVSNQVPYELVIKILDELNIAETEITQRLAAKGMKRERKFAMTPFTEEDREDLKGL